MKNLLLICFLFFTACSTVDIVRTGPDKNEDWRVVHLLGYENNKDLDTLASHLPKLRLQGINIIIVEVDYNFDFKSFPELKAKDDVITKDKAKWFAEECKKNDIRLAIQFQCLGHQSWAKTTFPLLTKYPHLDVTPGLFPENKDIYCREWDPTNPEVYKYVFPLMGEIIDAFEADLFHVGMDEVFLLGSKHSKSTYGQNPAELYAKAVNDIYDFLVKEKNVEMMMWGDRFIDAAKIDYGEWEASANGMAPAINMVPKDIIICDWHYEERDSYPSVQMFIDEGFRVLPTSWKRVGPTKVLINQSYEIKDEKMLGHLFSTWGRVDLFKFESLQEGLKLLKTK